MFQHAYYKRAQPVSQITKRQGYSPRCARFGQSLMAKFVSASPNDASCAKSCSTVKYPHRVLVAHRALLANHSLNRTFCGVRPLGFISFSPNSRTPQNAG